MQDLMLTPSTVVILAAILALAIVAARRMTQKGLCDCGDGAACEGCHGCQKHAQSHGQKRAACNRCSL